METITKSNVKFVEIKHSLIPKKWEETPRVVGMSECKEVALSLAYAFAADDLACYLLNTNDMENLSQEEKWRLHVDMFTYIVVRHTYCIRKLRDCSCVTALICSSGRWKLRACPSATMLTSFSGQNAHVLKGEVHVIGSDYAAVALWLPPGGVMDDWWTLLRSGQWRLWYQLSTEGRQRYYHEMLPLLHHTKMEVLGKRDDNAYYLVYLGTKPHARGRGYARKLIQHMADRVSLLQVPNTDDQI